MWSRRSERRVTSVTSSRAGADTRATHASQRRERTSDRARVTSDDTSPRALDFVTAAVIAEARLFHADHTADKVVYGAGHATRPHAPFSHAFAFCLRVRRRVRWRRLGDERKHR